MPGISLAQTGREGGLATLFLDGANSNHTKVLLDGAPINDSGGFIDLSNLMLDNVEKIEVVHGAESALYGSDAMSGVIQIFTKRGETREAGTGLERRRRIIRHRTWIGRSERTAWKIRLFRIRVRHTFDGRAGTE